MSEEITLQKIFDLAWQAFIIEDKPPSYGKNPLSGDWQCLYEDEYGNSCAVGLAIPKGHPARKFGGSLWYLVQAHQCLFDVKMRSLSYDDSITFQTSLHDKFVGVDGMWMITKEERMNRYIEVAEIFGLTIPAAKPKGEPI